MERLPREILFHILDSVSIGDSVNLFSTCRPFMGLGLTFLESYLGDTEEARLVADEELAVIGAITRTLGLDKSIKRGRPYSIQPISSEIGNQLMCYDNLICFLQRGYICISNNCGASEYAINIREITSLADPTEQIDENDDKPGFPRLSRAYFQICGNDILQNVGYEDSTGDRRIGTARVANQVGIVYTIEHVDEDMNRDYGYSLFFANFDARCERWTSLRGPQTGRFTTIE